MFNNSHIKMGRYSRIAHILFNSSMHDNIRHEPDYANKLRKVTEINLTNSCQHYVIIGDKFRRQQLNNLLHQVHALNFEIVVFWFEGSWPMTQEFEEKLLNAVDGKWKQNDWLCAGHILDRQNDDGPHFHQQCIILNIDAWKQLTANKDLSSSWRSPLFPAYEMSDEHIHDDYTPLSLIPRPESPPIQNINFSDNKLDCLIPIALSNNMHVMNLDYDIRCEKHCCYPEDDIEETKSWLLDNSWSKGMSADELHLFSKKINEDKRELIGFKMMDSHVMYVTNTESIPAIDEYDCTVMTAPCSGLHQFKHMVNARNTLTRVIWTDFSAAGIWWTKKVLAEWDGIGFCEFYNTHKAELEEKWVAFYANNFDPELADSFEKSFDTQSSWLEHWDWIRSLDHTFMQVDLIKDWKVVCKEIGNNETVFMQISNIWQYEINYLNNGNFAPQLAFIGLIKELLDNNKELYISGDSPGGVYYNYQNMKQLVSSII